MFEDTVFVERFAFLTVRQYDNTLQVNRNVPRAFSPFSQERFPRLFPGS